MASSHEFGRGCEEMAAQALTARGWRILGRNYRLGHKEIDLIARRGRMVAFVEVKGRSSSRFGHPVEAVGAAKRRDILQVARSWIARHGTAGDEYRFDAVSVLRRRGGPPSIEHFEDAWRPGE